ncbi:MAG: SsrA-binding protein SmpB [Ignavibacteria bacterium]|nr:SsrA-binding protein SmpB [Ignavibacteria bacterium]
MKIIGTNRKAYYQYIVLKKYEAGIVLMGTEVKSLREAKVNMQEAYAAFIKDELWLLNCHISEYKFGNINNHEPVRNRKLLLNKNELRKIKTQLQEKGLTMIPLQMYFRGAKVKVELGIAKGKKLFDKRETIKKRETERKLKRI